MAGNHNSGRKRKPTAAFKLYGGYREDRHGKRMDGKLRPGKPQRPIGMSADARKVWDMVLKTLPADAQSELDGPMLAGVAQWFAVYWNVTRKMVKAKEVDSELIQVAARAWKCFCEGATQFGMSPTARAKIQTAVQEAGDDFDKFMTQAQ